MVLLSYFVILLISSSALIEYAYASGFLFFKDFNALATVLSPCCLFKYSSTFLILSNGTLVIMHAAIYITIGAYVDATSAE